MATSSHNDCIERVVAIALVARFDEAPAGSHKGGHLPRKHHAAPCFSAFGKLQKALNLVLKKFANVARVIEIAPLAYMRGRTLDNAFILLDEAQNTTPSQMKMFLTRMGPSSKVIITGDKTQIDLPKNQQSGLKDASETLKSVKGIAFVELDGSDVVRHRLVKDILDAYDKKDNG